MRQEKGQKENEILRQERQIMLYFLNWCEKLAPFQCDFQVNAHVPSS